jgi:adenylate kinase family enzyme
MEDMEDILSCYKNVLVKIDGTRTIEEVFKAIEDNLQ